MAKALGIEVSSYRVLSYEPQGPAFKPYEALVCASFLHSLRLGNKWFHDIHTEIYYKTYHDLFERYLNAPTAIVRLAVLDEDKDVCLGWSLTRGSVLDYVYVKEDSLISFRKQGIGKSLLPKEFDTISHLTREGRAIWKAKFPKVIFNPFR